MFIVDDFLVGHHIKHNNRVSIQLANNCIEGVVYFPKTNDTVESVSQTKRMMDKISNSKVNDDLEVEDDVDLSISKTIKTLLTKNNINTIKFKFEECANSPKDSDISGSINSDSVDVEKLESSVKKYEQDELNREDTRNITLKLDGLGQYSSDNPIYKFKCNIDGKNKILNRKISKKNDKDLITLFFNAITNNKDIAGDVKFQKNNIISIENHKLVDRTP